MAAVVKSPRSWDAQIRRAQCPDAFKQENFKNRTNITPPVFASKRPCFSDEPDKYVEDGTLSKDHFNSSRRARWLGEREEKSDADCSKRSLGSADTLVGSGEFGEIQSASIDASKAGATDPTSGARDYTMPYPKSHWTKPFLEYLAVILWTVPPPTCLVATIIAAVYAPLWLGAYVLWFVLFDCYWPWHGGSSRNGCMLNFPLWNYFRSYFSSRLILTPEAAAPGVFDGNDRYVLGYSPHGIFCLGAFANLCLPRRKDCPLPAFIQPTTLGMGFFTPFFREIVIGYGFIAVDRPSICKVLLSEPRDTQRTPVDGSSSSSRAKKAVMICVGGAREALYTCPGRMALVLKRRRGFVEVAISTGAALIPSLTFGENDIFRTLGNRPGSRFRRFQAAVLKYTGVSPCVFYGDTILGFVIPRRKSLVTVVGAPIPTGPKDPHPSPERVDAVHREYLVAVEKIWNDYKDLYAKDRTAELEFVH